MGSFENWLRVMIVIAQCNCYWTDREIDITHVFLQSQKSISGKLWLQSVIEKHILSLGLWENDARIVVENNNKDPENRQERQLTSALLINLVHAILLV